MIEYTVKQIAELLKVSKPTVQKAINELNIIPERKQNNGRAFYNYDNTVSIIKYLRTDFDIAALSHVSHVGGKLQSETAKPQNRPPDFAKSTAKHESELQNTARVTEKPPDQELELLKDMYETLKKQLDEKDRQLAIKDNQIMDLSEKLSAALQLVKGQQYITAADKTTELLEADNKKEDSVDSQLSNDNMNNMSVEQKPQERFWKRFFRKK